MEKPYNSNPCDEYLSDKDYLLHMIPHHQVAIDISLEMQKKSKTPVMQEILRKLIWTQNREIMMRRLPELFETLKVETVENYPSYLLETLKSLPPRNCAK